MQHCEQFLKRRRFLLFLPLIVHPFLTVIFWLLGGGSPDATVLTPTARGLNLQLPNANVKTLSALDKMSFYAKADRDSIERLELERMDPNLGSDETIEALLEERHEKLARVQQPYPTPSRVTDAVLVQRSSEIAQLTDMVQALQQQRKDPEMEVLNETLQQLVALQQPALIKENTVIPRNIFKVTDEGGLFSEAFYGESGIEPDTLSFPVLKAVVHGEQILQTGSVIKLRLVSAIVIHQEKIPAGAFVFGVATLGAERLHVSIHAIHHQGKIYPVALTVMDLDGMEGIYMPGSTTREVIKQAAEQGVQSIGWLGIDPSLKGQAASAGMGAVKSLLGRKARQVRVTIKSGYQLLLQDEKRRDR